MLAHPEGDALGPLQISRQPLGQLLAGMGQVGPEFRNRAFTAPAEAVPHLGAGLLGGHKQHEALPFWPVGQEQGHRLRFIETGEIPEVAVLAEGPLAIGVVNRQRRRRDHRRCPTELGKKAPTPLGKGRRIGHGAQFSSPGRDQSGAATGPGVGRDD